MTGNRYNTPDDLDPEALKLLSQLHSEAVSALASVQGASSGITRLVIRSLGPGTIDALAKADVITLDPASKRHPRRLSVTRFGRKVIEAASRLVETEPPSSPLKPFEGGLPRALVLAISVGHEHLRVALVDTEGELIAGPEATTNNVDWAMEETLSSAERMSRELIGGAHVDVSQVVGVGMAIPGPINPETGTLASLSVLPDWGRSHIPTRVSEAFATLLKSSPHVAVDNDANLAMLGEAWRGAGRGYGHAVFVKCSAGIGAGLYMDGQLYRGHDGRAGEIGHMHALHPDETFDYGKEEGKLEFDDRCEQFGCLEKRASIHAVVDFAKKRLTERIGGDHTDLDIRSVIERARQGDTDCRDAIAQAGWFIGVGIAEVVQVVNPQVVIMGGTLAEADDLLLASVKRALSDHVPEDTEVSVAIASTGLSAGLFGASRLVFEELGERIA